MTKARSGKAPPAAPYAGTEHHKPEGDGDPRYRLPSLVSRAGEIQLDGAGSRRQFDSDERVVRTSDACSLPIHSCFPTGIVVLGYYERRTWGRRRAEVDLHFARLV